MQSRENERENHRQSSRIQPETALNIALQKRKNTALQAASRTIEVQKIPARTG
jgi:hypothetical protein